MATTAPPTQHLVRRVPLVTFALVALLLPIPQLQFATKAITVQQVSIHPRLVRLAHTATLLGKAVPLHV